MNGMEYKSYLATVEYDPDAEIFHGEVVNTRSVLTFQGRSVDDLKAALKDTVEDYLAWCAERGKEPEKPYSGKFLVRVPPEVHRRLSIEAAKIGKSLNALVAERLTPSNSHK